MFPRNLQPLACGMFPQLPSYISGKRNRIVANFVTLSFASNNQRPIIPFAKSLSLLTQLPSCIGYPLRDIHYAPYARVSHVN